MARLEEVPELSRGEELVLVEPVPVHGELPAFASGAGEAEPVRESAGELLLVLPDGAEVVEVEAVVAVVVVAVRGQRLPVLDDEHGAVQVLAAAAIGADAAWGSSDAPDGPPPSGVAAGGGQLQSLSFQVRNRSVWQWQVQ